MNSIAVYLPYIQIIAAVFLIAVVLLQKGDTEVGGAFGGNDNWSAAYHTRRGFEKLIFNLTIALAVLFVVASLLNLAIA